MTIAEQLEKRGKEIGKEIGRKHERERIALRMLREGLDIDLIIRSTEYSKEKILGLKNQRAF